MALDLYIFNFLNSFAGQSRIWDAIFVFMASDLAIIIPAAVVLWIAFEKHELHKQIQMLLIVSAAAVLSRFIITEIIRNFYNRPRPFDVSEVNLLFQHEGYGSFPSGHSTFFFAIATAVYLYNKKWGIVFFAATFLMTLSRVIAGIHWPSDILGGMAIGVISAYLMFYVSKKIKPPLKPGKISEGI
ncbi:MAG: phosphatase PAP2 family protein [Candidatus Spechtbacterales bacterium]